jgi:hypothetical protein
MEGAEADSVLQPFKQRHAGILINKKGSNVTSI